MEGKVTADAICILLEEHNVNNLRYVDGTVVIAETKKTCKKIVGIVEEASRKKGLESKGISNGRQSKQKVSTDQYLYQRKYTQARILIASDGRNNTEITSRIAQAKKFSENEINTNK